MKKLFKITAYLMATLAVITLVLQGCGIEIPEFLSFMTIGTGGVSTAATLAGVSETPKGTPTDNPADVNSLDKNKIITDHFIKMVVTMNKSRFPLETMSRKNTKNIRKASGQRIHYFSKEGKPLSDTIDSSASGNGASSSAPAKSFTYISTGDGTASLWIKPSNPKLWKPNDTVLMRATEVYKNGDEMIIGGATKAEYDTQFFIEAKENDAIKLVPTGGMRGKNTKAGTTDFPLYVMPGFTDSTVLYHMATAYNETDVKGDVYETIPEEEIQYTQRFFTQIEMTKYAEMEKKHINYGWEEIDRENIMAFRAEQEMTYWFGEKHVMNNGKVGGRRYFTKGVTRCISKMLSYGKMTAGDRTITKQQYTTWMKELFTGNSGSKDRVLFAGSTVIENIELLRETEKQISGRDVQETYLGIKCPTIESSFGRVHIVHTPLFDEAGWSDRGVFLDMEYIERYEFDNFKARTMDMEKLNERKTTARFFEENSAMILRYSDCHAMLKPQA